MFFRDPTFPVMKRRVFYLVLLCCGLPLLQASAQIVFASGPLDGVLERAREEKKFVVVYLHSQEFGGFDALAGIWRNPDVGFFLNQKAVVAAFDRGSESGLEFSRDYEVKSYPALFFLSESGEVLGTMLGLEKETRAEAMVLIMMGHAESQNRNFRPVARKN